MKPSGRACCVQSYWGGDWSRVKLLYDVMCGKPPTVSPLFGYFPVITGGHQPVSSSWVTWEDAETQTLLPTGTTSGTTARTHRLEAMTDHAYLDDEQGVNRTVYTQGTEVLVNATFAPFDDGDVHLKPSSYRIDGRSNELGAA